MEIALSLNHGGKLLGHQFVVLHYTASSNFETTKRWLCSPKSRASAHYLIGRAGETVNLVPADLVAWHAGVSSYAGYEGLNKWSIGIELVNWGPLFQATDSHFRPVGFNDVIDPADVYVGRHKNPRCSFEFWHKYSDEQVDACIRLCRELLDKYPSIREIVGHDDIAPNRKFDVGPAWDWAGFRAALGYGSETDKTPPPSTGA